VQTFNFTNVQPLDKCASAHIIPISAAHQTRISVATEEVHVDYIFLAVAIFWIAQFGLAWWQLRRFHARIGVLRRTGRTAVGMKGNRFSGRTYAVLVVDAQQRISSAEVFDGWTVFSQLRPVPELVGRHLSALRSDEPPAGMRKARWEALQHAAGFLEARPAAPTPAAAGGQ
jgi:glucitol operon activator protein